MLFFPHNYDVPVRVVGGALVHEFLISYIYPCWVVFSGLCLGSAFSAAVLVIHCVWISKFHHLMSGWLIILYIMIAYSMKSPWNLYVHCSVTKVLFYCMHASSFCVNFTFDQLMILYLTFLSMCIHWKFWYILWSIFSKKSVWLVHFAMVYLTMYILWRVCMTRCTMKKCCLVICITVYMIFFVICNCSHAVLSIFAVPVR